MDIAYTPEQLALKQRVSDYMSNIAFLGLIHRVGHLGYVSAKRKVIY